MDWFDLSQASGKLWATVNTVINLRDCKMSGRILDWLRKKDSAARTMKMKSMMNGYPCNSGYTLTLQSQIRFDKQNKSNYV